MCATTTVAVLKIKSFNFHGCEHIDRMSVQLFVFLPASLRYPQENCVYHTLPVCICEKKHISYVVNQGGLMVVFKLFSTEMFRSSHTFIRAFFEIFVQLGLSLTKLFY